MKQTLHPGIIRVGVLMADACARHVASQLMQLQRNLQTLLAGHLAVAFNLFVESGCRRHHAIMAAVLQRSKIIQPGVGATRLRRVAGQKRFQL